MPQHRVISMLRPSLILLAMIVVLCGGVYPLTVTLIGQVVFPGATGGSLIMDGEKVVGSELIGQHFTSPKYFWGRPSNTKPPYNAAASAGSYAGPLNQEYHEEIRERYKALRASDPRRRENIPAELLLVSASGLDPHISVEAAMYQVPRVLQHRSIGQSKLVSLIEANTTEEYMGVFGQPVVNVLKLNLALDKTAR